MQFHEFSIKWSRLSVEFSQHRFPLLREVILISPLQTWLKIWSSWHQNFSIDSPLFCSGSLKICSSLLTFSYQYRFSCPPPSYFYKYNHHFILKTYIYETHSNQGIQKLAKKIKLGFKMRRTQATSYLFLILIIPWSKFLKETLRLHEIDDNC